MTKLHNSSLALIGLAMLMTLSAGCGKTSTGPTVDTTAPTVSSTNPANGATGMTAITATFSEAMTVSTISAATFSLSGPGAADVPGVVSYGDANNTARFSPSNILVPGSIYTATVNIGVKDVAGNAMVVNKVWTFTTSTTSPLPMAPLDPEPRRAL